MRKRRGQNQYQVNSKNRSGIQKRREKRTEKEKE